MVLLEVNGVTKHFGGVAANENVSFSVEEGELVGIMGPNGAGKTTLFDQITGFQAPDSGRIIFDGRDVTGKRPDRICAAGLARTFQIVRVFPELTVLDNVVVGALHRHKDVGVAQKRTYELLERVGLEDRSNALGRELPLAARKRVQLARALATEPRMLFLDEAMAGLNKKEAGAAVELLKSFRQEITIVMTEHVMEILMPLSDRVIVLVEGKKLVEGQPKEVSTDKRVVAAYLGEKFVASGE
ncbi:MAG: ABC transporter ATP-binding protein [Actinobacteria bacterium]|jgi:branched-chain amino acid transport system ATP-binding protein|nr:ABC transporter ATP-binding protein [Actinomycetota bacterium]MDQ3533462.1 ABC transporter ATP-binding protein [Actinomycetota bacterium]